MNLIGIKAQKASEQKITTKVKNKVLNDYAKLIKKEKKFIISQNLKDINYAKKKELKENLIKRLHLNENKLSGIINSILKIAKLKDPIDNTLEKWKRPNGLNIRRVSIPIGIIGVIYESRPNVTSDVASLCFKSGNVVILKGGSEAINSNRALAKVLDLSKVPIIGHLEGLCHTYIDKDAELKMAKEVVFDAKLRNTSICGATETILIHKNIVKKFSNPILQKLENSGCKIVGDKILKSYYKGKIYPAKEKDWSTEYLASIVSVKVVKNSDEAINHINKYGTMHTDSIITKNKKTAKYFLKNVKSSIAMHNTSTQFADGGEFGFGGEVGISTNTLPPRGPVGLNQLISYKYEIFSNGKTRN